MVEHEGELLLEELVLAHDLAVIRLLRGLEEARRRRDDRLVRLLVLGHVMEVGVELLRAEDLVDRLDLRDVRLDLEQAVRDRHERHVLPVAGGVGVDLADRGVGDEGHALHPDLRLGGQRGDQLVEHALAAARSQVMSTSLIGSLITGG